MIGLLLLILAAIVPDKFATSVLVYAGMINFWFAFFNMLPISELDGNKIFFGSIVFWSFLAILTLIGLGYAFLLI